MIKDRVRFNIEEDVIVRLDQIAEDYQMTRNELINKIVQKKLRIKTRINNEPDLKSVDKFLDILLREKFEKWDITVKRIYKEVQKIAYVHFLEIKDDGFLRDEVGKYAERNYKRYLENKELLPLHWQMVVKANQKKEE